MASTVLAPQPPRKRWVSPHRQRAPRTRRGGGRRDRINAPVPAAVPLVAVEAERLPVAAVARLRAGAEEPQPVVGAECLSTRQIQADLEAPVEGAVVAAAAPTLLPPKRRNPSAPA